MPAENLIQFRRGTAAAWVSANPVLSIGEPAFETDTLRLKIGDGATAYTSMAYVTRAITSKAANYTLAIKDRGALVNATSGAVTITLPTAASAKDVEFFVKKTDATGNTVTVDAAGAETIDGDATQVITEQYTTITVYSDGTAWYII